jgi:hypothetical protein
MTRDVSYCEAVSTLTWAAAALATRPTIAFAGAAAPFFATNAGPALLDSVKWTSRHLSFTHGEANSPLKGSANANGSIAEDWPAASRHASLVDGSTVPRPSKRQETARSPTTGHNYVARLVFVGWRGSRAARRISPGPIDISCGFPDPACL